MDIPAGAAALPSLPLRFPLLQEGVLTFAAIALGGLLCLPAGLIADRVGKARVALWAMVGSGLAGIATALSFGGPVWLTVALVLLWGATIPTFWAADEDYHFLYVESLTTQQQLPSPDRPLYPPEYGTATALIHYNEYGQGPRRTYGDDPRASLRELEAMPDSTRQPSEFGRGVGVVHPPLYPVIGAVANAAAAYPAGPYCDA